MDVTPTTTTRPDLNTMTELKSRFGEVGKLDTALVDGSSTYSVDERAVYDGCPDFGLRGGGEVEEEVIDGAFWG